jgi:hypothetical protein
MLFMSLAEVVVTSVDTSGEVIRVEARSAADGAGCPGCGSWSRRVHGSYGGFPVICRWSVGPFATVLHEFVLTRQCPGMTKVLGIVAASLALSFGIGMLSGGQQHFEDFPARAAMLIPFGLALSEHARRADDAAPPRRPAAAQLGGHPVGDTAQTDEGEGGGHQAEVDSASWPAFPHGSPVPGTACAGHTVTCADAVGALLVALTVRTPTSSRIRPHPSRGDVRNTGPGAFSLAAAVRPI